MKREKIWDFIGTNWLPLLTVAAGFLAAAFHSFGKLSDTITLSLILGIVCLLATTEIIERAKRFEAIDSKFEALDENLYGQIQKILLALGGEVKIHRGRQQFLEYITKCIEVARDRIDTTSLSPGRTSLHGPQPADQIIDTYEAAIEKAVRDRSVRLRRVRIVSNEERFNSIEQEMTRLAGLPFFSAVYLQPGHQMPVFNVVIVDDEVAIGGIDKPQSDEIISISTKHSLLRELVLDYFNELWRRAISLNEHQSQVGNILQDLRREISPNIEFINGMEEVWLKSAELVPDTQQRLWVTGFGTSSQDFMSKAKDKYNNAFEELALSNPDIELRRVTRVDSEKDLEHRLKQVEGYLNTNNFLLNCVVGGPPMIDIFLRDNDVLMLGLQHHLSSMAHDAIVLIRDQQFIVTVAGWYERFLWVESIPIKGKKGLKDENIVRIRELLGHQAKEGK